MQGRRGLRDSLHDSAAIAGSFGLQSSAIVYLVVYPAQARWSWDSRRKPF
jgi:hypothetical protein